MSTPETPEQVDREPAADPPSETRLAREPALEEIMPTVFGLKSHVCRAYFALVAEPRSTAAEIGERVGRDRSNVNRSLRILVERDLADRRRALLDDGGHVYHYTPTPLPEVRNRMHTALTAWVAAAHDRLDEFGEDVTPE